MTLLERFLPRIEFESYEDFKQNYTVNIPKNFNFGFDVVDAWAEIDKEKKALVWCDDHGGEEVFTFSDISRLSNQTVHFLKAQGIGKGDVVMVILRRRYEYWIMATALCKLGATLIPATLQLMTKDIVYRCNAANVKMIVGVNDNGVLEQVEAALEKTPSVIAKATVAEKREGWLCFNEEIKKYPDTYERPTGAEATSNDDIMLMYFTSGTTGMPKMVTHTFTHPLGHIVTAKYWQRVQDGKLHMSVSDSGWAKFGWGKIYGQWLSGAVIFCYDMEKFIAKKLMEKIHHYGVTTFCAPPTMYRFMLQEEESLIEEGFSTVEQCCTAGEPLNPEVFNRFKAITGLSLTEGFGQTESSVLLANFQWFEPKPGSMGKPSPIYDLRLLTADKTEAEDGEEGEITIMNVKTNRPVGLFTGYAQAPEVNEQVMGDGNYNLSDVAWRDNDGYYWFVGRSDDVIKCSGYRIGPFEVESALIEHPAVVECAVTAVPDPIRGQVVKATIVLTKQYSPSDALKKELQNHVKRVTAPYKYPRVIEFVDELPKTLGGKIKRALIRKTDSE
ncbi:MAG: acetyl-CoA synthetase [Ruminococcaceae bacterium]|nr:acetyl-CoA synthetase [Oscillospiraceae bacterium]